MRLSDAGFHQRRTKPLYFNHRFPPWPTEATARDRSNRLLGGVQDGAAGRYRQLCGDEALGWIQVIFAGLVDDPEIAGAFRLRVRQRNVNLTSLEGYLVAGVIETDK